MKKAIVILCLFISITLLYFSFANFAEQPPKKPSIVRFKYDSTKIDLYHFWDQIDKRNITAIGIIASRTCASCINEFFEFSALIDSINNRFFNGDKIVKIYVVTGGDSASAMRFKKVHQLTSDVYFVELHTKLGKKLNRWDSETVANQWIFVNNRNSMITSRILALNGLTPFTFKWDLLNKALFTGDMNTITRTDNSNKEVEL